MKDRPNSVTSSELGEPMIDAFFDDVVEYGDSAFMGRELLAEDGNTNRRVPCSSFGENVVEVSALG